MDANENFLMEALKESEARIMERMQTRVEEALQDQVKEMLNAQLNKAGFDQELTAADLSTRRSALLPNTTGQSSYAGVTLMTIRQENRSSAK